MAQQIKCVKGLQAALANSSRLPMQESNAPAGTFEDRRPEASAQRKLQAQIDNSPKLKRAGQLQNILTSQMHPALQMSAAAPLQCWPTIVIDSTEHPDAKLTQIEHFLSSHRQSVPIMFESVLEDINGTFSGRSGAEQLATAITLAQVKITGSTSTEQKSIMNKLGAIAYLISTTRGALEGQKSEAIKLCGRLEDDQGLCFGFTEIFKRHAQWESALWKSIATWVPEMGSSEEMLDTLNTHLDETIRWASGRRDERSNEALLLLKEAWQYMEYSDLPDWIDAVKGSTSKTKLSKMGQITRIVKVPQVESLDRLTCEFEVIEQKGIKQRKEELASDCDAEISEQLARLKKLDGLFDLKQESAGEELILSQFSDDEIQVALIKPYKTLNANTRMDPKQKIRMYSRMARMAIKRSIVDTAYQFRFGELVEEKPEVLAQKKQNQQQLITESAFMNFEHYLGQAGKLIDSACDHSTKGELMLEISTAGHSMSARCTKGNIVFLEPEYLGVGTFDSLSGLSENLWKGLQVGAMPLELEKGIALDIEMSDVQPAEGKGEDKGSSLNLLNELEGESIAAFSTFAQGDDPAKFLKKNNPILFKKVQFTDS